MKAKFNQIMANFGRGHVQELMKQQTSQTGTAYFPQVS
jgi:hypothetical protein